jgi:hypothetical protein
MVKRSRLQKSQLKKQKATSYRWRFREDQDRQIVKVRMAKRRIQDNKFANYEMAGTKFWTKNRQPGEKCIKLENSNFIHYMPFTYE